MASFSAAGTESYRTLCATHQVPLFHQPWWLDTVCTQWIGAVAEGSDDGVGLWPVPLERKLGVRMSRSPFLTPYLGPVMTSGGTRAGAIPPDLQRTLLHRLFQALPAIPVWHTAAQPYSWDTQFFEDAGFVIGQRPTYLLPLLGRSEQDLFSSLHTGVRREVRRANEEVMVADEPDLAAAMYAMQDATLRRKGTRLYHSEALFSRLVREAHRRGCGALWIARRRGEVVGAQWSTWDAERCYNIGLTRIETEAGKFVSAALLWQAIRHAHSLGLQIFDFEGSSIAGIANFFARFGGTAHPYLTLRKTESRLWRIVQQLRP